MTYLKHVKIYEENINNLREMDKLTNTVGDINIPLSVTDRKSVRI